MAQQKPKNNTLKWVGGIAVPIIVYLIATSGSSAPTTTTNKPADKKKSSIAKDSILDETDFHANFASYEEPISDKFVPLVFKASPQGSDRLPPMLRSDLNLPLNFTGGEGNWGFTGTVFTDNRWSALVENATTAQNTYLKKGDKWKSSTVVNVTENVLTLRDLSGTVKDLSMQADIQAAMAKQAADLADLRPSNTPTRNPNNAFSPMNPGAMIGQISPDPTAAAVADDGSGMQNIQMNGGGRRRGGRGRGGRGGGGGNGGGFGG